MHNGIPLSVLGECKIRHGSHHLTVIGKRHLDRIVESAAGNTFQPGAVGIASKDTAGSAFEYARILCLHLVPMQALGNIQSAIRPQKRTVRTVCVLCLPTNLQDSPRIGDTVVIDIFKAKILGWTYHEQRVIVPQHAHRKADLGGKYRPRVEDAVSVCVFKTQNLALGRGGHFYSRQIFPGGLRDEQAAAIIEIHKHGVGRETRLDSTHHFKSLRHRERAQSAFIRDRDDPGGRQK